MAADRVIAVASCSALWGKSVEPSAKLEPGCPVRCMPALAGLKELQVPVSQECGGCAQVLHQGSRARAYVAAVRVWR